jgi:hypothetical protein
MLARICGKGSPHILLVEIKAIMLFGGMVGGLLKNLNIILTHDPGIILLSICLKLL